jgi:hypothetical protein
MATPTRYLRRRGNLRGLGEPDRIHDFANPYPQPDPGAGLPLWIYPPVNWENVDQLNYVALPAIATEATIISFQVPTGRNGIINKVACNFVGGGWVEGSGDVLWRILVDGGTPPGANSYQAIPASLGSPAQPVGISGFRIFENQIVAVTIFNSAVVVAGQLAGARLCGYLYPRELEDSNIFI